MTVKGAEDDYLSMYTMPVTAPQKVGVIFYGLAVGVCAALATEAALIILAAILAVILELLHLAGNDGGSSWFVVGSAFYGVYVALAVGACRVVASLQIPVAQIAYRLKSLFRFHNTNLPGALGVSAMELGCYLRRCPR